MTHAVVDADHLEVAFDVTMTTDGMTTRVVAIAMAIALETVIVMVTGKKDLRDGMRGARNEVRIFFFYQISAVTCAQNLQKKAQN